VYKLVPTDSVPLKTYWCADLQVAEEVADELRGRYGCECEIVDVPEKHNWEPEKAVILKAVLSYPRRFRSFQLKDDLMFGCSQEQLEDALAHARGNILKIKDSEEIFCFQANDPFWQRQYMYASAR
jgi:hypothetical protein